MVVSWSSLVTIEWTNGYLSSQAQVQAKHSSACIKVRSGQVTKVTQVTCYKWLISLAFSALWPAWQCPVSNSCTPWFLASHKWCDHSVPTRPVWDKKNLWSKVVFITDMYCFLCYIYISESGDSHPCGGWLSNTSIIQFLELFQLKG